MSEGILDTITLTLLCLIFFITVYMNVYIYTNYHVNLVQLSNKNNNMLKMNTVIHVSYFMFSEMEKIQTMY